MGIFTSVNEAFAWIEGFANFERQTPMFSDYRLDRMAAMLADFSNPQLAVPAIHVAGSKGKGTVTHWTAAALSRLGFRVGRYTSPHLADYRERISLADGFFDDAIYLEVIGELREYVDGLRRRADWPHGDPTTFELLTLAAYLAFRREKLDWMVIETGLGGLLDATNLMRPAVCAITMLELEHTDILGNTIGDIARQKAGIFKPGAALLAQRPLDNESPALAIIEASARGVGGFVEWVEPAANEPNRPMVAAILRRLLNGGLLSACWGSEDPDGLSEAVSLKHQIPGRLEWLQWPGGSASRRLMLDVAHTPASVARTLEVFRPDKDDLLVFGSVAGKRHAEMAAILAPAFRHIIVTTPGSFKKSEPEAVWQAFRAINGHARFLPATTDAFAALSSHAEGLPRSRILVCGSFYLAGALLPMLQGKDTTTCR
jgi:dihydrofolate synthase/folylpolyglutamate synthase